MAWNVRKKKNKSSKHYNVVVYKYKTNVKSIKSIGVNKQKSQSGMDKKDNINQTKKLTIYQHKFITKKK